MDERGYLPADAALVDAVLVFQETADGCKQHHTGTRRQTAIRAYQLAELFLVVGHKLDVLGLRVVGAQFDEHDVWRKRQRLLILSRLGVRSIALAEQGSTRHTKIAHLVVCSQIVLQLCRIAVLLPVGNAGAIGDAVAHTGHTHWAR